MNKTLKLILSFLLISTLTFSNNAQAFFDEQPNTQSQTTQPDQPQVQPSDSDEQTAKFAPDRIIVKFKEGKDPQRDTASLNTKHKVKQIKKLFTHQVDPKVLDAKFKDRAKRKPKNAVVPKLDQIYILEVETNTDILSMVSEYKQDPNVEYAEPDYEAKVQAFPQTLPNDTYVDPDQNGTWSTGAWTQSYEDLWGLKKIEADKAWDITQGAGVVVAVIDTGVDYNHPDLATNIWINSGEIPNNGIDDDNNGYIDDDKGWDFTTCEEFTNSGFCITPKSRDNDPMDGHGHGTHTSGTIAAKGNNNLGVIGVAPQARIMPAKGLNDQGGGYNTDLAAAVIYATDNGADVLSNSWGSYGVGSLPPQVLVDAFNYTWSQGVLSVAAAGNSAGNVQWAAPANIDSVIAVAAVDHNDQRSIWKFTPAIGTGYFTAASNIGQKVEVSAPGGGDPEWASEQSNMVDDILSTLSDSSRIGIERPELRVSSGYYRLAGTSMACPHAAGVAALIFSEHPDFTNEQVRTRLKEATDVYDLDAFPESYSEYMGSGRINAFKALGDPIPNLRIKDIRLEDSVAGYGDGDLIPESNERIRMVIDLKNIWRSATQVTATLSTTNPSVASIPVSSSSFGSIAQGETKNNTASPFIFEIGSIEFDTPVKFTLTTNADGINQTLNFTIRLGIRRLFTKDYTLYGVAISNNNILYKYGEGTWDLYLYDLLTNTERRITNDSFQESLPDIDGNKVVWQTTASDFHSDVYLYDFSTNTLRQMTDVQYDQNFPAISGTKMVWSDLRSGSPRIYLFDMDLDQEMQLSNTSWQSFPRIDGSKVTWQSVDDIYAYDLLTNQERRITSDYNNTRPDISGNKIVWEQWRTSLTQQHIFLYDFETGLTSQITQESSEKHEPKISGDKIIWLDWRLRPTFPSEYHTPNIYLYDLATNQEKQVTRTSQFASPTRVGGMGSYDRSCAIDGNKIVWFEVTAYGVGPYRMYLTEIPPSNHPPIFTPTSNKTVNEGASLSFTVSATDADNDPLTYTASNLPTGSSFDVSTHTFSWTPNYTQAGTYSVTFTVSDGQASINQTVLITVNNVPPPSAPSSLTAQAVSSTQINLSWTDNSTNETGFKIERSTASKGPFTQIVTTAADATSYSNTGLTAGTTYYYRLRATSTAGDSAYSNVANATTQAAGTIPTAPTALSATAVSSTQINLSWLDNSDNETGFKIERSTDNVTFAEITTTASNVATFNHTGLNAGTTYYYRLRATNQAGDSTYTNVSSATTLAVLPLTPSNLTAVAVSSTQINLSWQDNSTNETGFKIERSTSATTNFTQIATTGANVTTYSNSGLKSGTYYYRVRATNAVGDSAYSSVVNAATQTTGSLPLAPTNLTATPVSSSQINLSWTDTSNNETGFKIERSTNNKGPFTQIATTASNVMSYNNNTGLTSNTTYYYRVRAYNTAGDSAYSNVSSTRTLS